MEYVLHHLNALTESVRSIDRSGRWKLEDVVPVIKDARWLREANRQQLDVYRHHLAADLSIVFAPEGEHQLA